MRRGNLLPPPWRRGQFRDTLEKKPEDVVSLWTFLHREILLLLGGTDSSGLRRKGIGTPLRTTLLTSRRNTISSIFEEAGKKQ